MLWSKKGRSEERPKSAGSCEKNRAPGDGHTFSVLLGSLLQHLPHVLCPGNYRCGFTGWAVVDGKSGLVLPRAHEDLAACETGRGLCALHSPHLLRGPGPVEGEQVLLLLLNLVLQSPLSIAFLRRAALTTPSPLCEYPARSGSEDRASPRHRLRREPQPTRHAGLRAPAAGTEAAWPCQRSRS